MKITDDILEIEIDKFVAKMHKMLTTSFFFSIPLTILIDYYTLTGNAFQFALIWKSILIILLAANTIAIFRNKIKPMNYMIIPLYGIFIPFGYLISIVPIVDQLFLNLTYMITLCGISVVLIMPYKKSLLFITTAIISYFYFYFGLSNYSFAIYFSNLGGWIMVFIIIMPIVSHYNYFRIKKETAMRFDLKNKNEEIQFQSNEILKQKNELYELNQTKDKFFSIISHDLKNPIFSIANTLNDICDSKDEISTQEKDELILLMKDSANNLYELLENLLDWSRSQRNTILINPSEFDLNYVIMNNIGLIENSLKFKNIKLLYTPKANLNCFADLPTINAILRNIISNSIKFTNQNGTIEISVADQKNEMLIVSIADNGIGIPENIMEDLFRIDKNVSRPGTSNEKGTGLGLILCKEFIEKNNGKIWVESKEGIGTTFSISIPKAKTIS